MRYAILNIIYAEKHGLNSDNHLKKDDMMIVNEKELLYSTVDMNVIVLYTNKEIKNKIKKDGYKL